MNKQRNLNDPQIGQITTSPSSKQHASVMVLFESSGMNLSLYELADLATLVMAKTGNDPAGALLKAIGVVGMGRP